MAVGPFVVAFFLTLVAGLGFAATESYAGDSFQGSGRIVDRILPHGGRVQDLIVPGGFFALPEPRRFEFKRPAQLPVDGRRFPNRFIGSGGVGFAGVYAPPLAYTTTDPGYADPNYYAPMDPTGGFGGQPVYGVQPTYAPPAYTVAATPPPPPPPMPSVVEYPNGRFELRGDGMTMPYNWVWIPNPPPPPPVAAPGPDYSPPTAYSPPGPVYSPP